jgi:hypothetical protein
LASSEKVVSSHNLNNSKTQVSKLYLLLTSHQCWGVGVLYIQIILKGFEETISMKQVFLQFYLNNNHIDKVDSHLNPYTQLSKAGLNTWS